MTPEGAIKLGLSIKKEHPEIRSAQFERVVVKHKGGESFATRVGLFVPSLRSAESFSIIVPEHYLDDDRFNVIMVAYMRWTISMFRITLPQLIKRGCNIDIEMDDQPAVGPDGNTYDRWYKISVEIGADGWKQFVPIHRLFDSMHSIADMVNDFMSSPLPGGDWILPLPMPSTPLPKPGPFFEASESVAKEPDPATRRLRIIALVQQCVADGMVDPGFVSDSFSGADDFDQVGQGDFALVQRMTAAAVQYILNPKNDGATATEAVDAVLQYVEEAG